MKTQKTLLNATIRLAELILQHRVDIRPAFIGKCRQLASEIAEKAESKTTVPIMEVPERAVEHEMFGIRSRLAQLGKSSTFRNHVRISFKAVEKATGKVFELESWVITHSKLKQNQDSEGVSNG